MYKELLPFRSTSFLKSQIRSSVAGSSSNPDLLRLTAVVVIALSLLSIAGVVNGQSQGEAAALIAEAKSFWKKNDQEQALVTIRKAISADPRNPAAYVQLAMIHAAMNDDDKARMAVEEAFKIDPNYPPAHQQRASQLRRGKDYEGAIREAKLALSLKPDQEFEAYSHSTLGRIYEELKRYDEALNEYREAIRSNPADGFHYGTLGSAFFSLKRYNQAENAFRRAVEINPQDSHSVVNLGAALHNQAKKDEAIRYYREYLRLEPKAGDRGVIEQRISQLESTPQPLLLNQFLLIAAQEGDAASVAALLMRGADPNYKSSYDYQSPLSAAARKGDLEVVKLLLARGAKDDDGAAMSNAYERGNQEIEKLLQQAAPPTPKVLNRVLVTAIRKGDTAKAQSLIASGADNLDGALVSAVDQEKELAEVVRLLLEKGARVNQPEAYRTPLMLAAGRGHVESVKLLLAKGADLNALTKENMNALEIAVYHQKTNVVRVLLDAGADPKANNLLRSAAGAPWVLPRDEGQSPKPSSEVMQLLLDKGANAKSPDGDRALMVANSPEKVKLLLAGGANPNAKGEYGLTPLLAAAKKGQAESVEALLSAGAEVNAKDSEGDTALLEVLASDENYAGPRKIVKDYPRLVRALLRATNIDVNAQNENGETALMRAVRLGNAESVRLLLGAGANVNAEDDVGDTAYILAYKKGDTEIEQLLASAVEQQTPRARNAYLAAAISKKDVNKVKELLDKGADPNYRYSIGLRNQNVTTIVLVEAAKVGHAGIVQLLLDKGADVNAKGLLSGSEHGLVHGTALEAANDPQIIEVLRKAAERVKN